MFFLLHHSPRSVAETQKYVSTIQQNFQETGTTQHGCYSDPTYPARSGKVAGLTVELHFLFYLVLNFKSRVWLRVILPSYSAKMYLATVNPCPHLLALPLLDILDIYYALIAVLILLMSTTSFQ